MQANKVYLFNDYNVESSWTRQAQLLTNCSRFLHSGSIIISTSTVVSGSQSTLNFANFEKTAWFNFANHSMTVVRVYMLLCLVLITGIRFF